MRPITLADLEVAMRHLSTLPAAAQKSAAVGLLADAHRADELRKSTGQMHPSFGAGTLMSLCYRRGVAPRAAQLDVKNISALSHLISALTQFYHHHDN